MSSQWWSLATERQRWGANTLCSIIDGLQSVIVHRQKGHTYYTSVCEDVVYMVWFGSTWEWCTVYSDLTLTHTQFFHVPELKTVFVRCSVCSYFCACTYNALLFKVCVRALEGPAQSRIVTVAVGVA